MQCLDLQTDRSEQEKAAHQLSDKLYTIAYRVAETNKTPHLEVWQEALAIGQSLPIMPLVLKGGGCVPVDLDRIYRTTCQRQRIPQALS